MGSGNRKLWMQFSSELRFKLRIRGINIYKYIIWLNIWLYTRNILWPLSNSLCGSTSIGSARNTHWSSSGLRSVANTLRALLPCWSQVKRDVETIVSLVEFAIEFTVL